MTNPNYQPARVPPAAPATGPVPASGSQPTDPVLSNPTQPETTADQPGPEATSPRQPSVGSEPIQTHPAPGFDKNGKVVRTRISGVWVGVIAAAIFVILLVVFIAQNSHQATVHFLGWHGRFSIALTILVSAVAGILLVAVPGSIRILQLRRALRKNVPTGKVR